MENFRVYAKIIGYVLPAESEEVALYGCVIKKMYEKEQKERGFKPIEIDVGDPGDPTYFRSYITSKIFSDQLFIKTDYVIYCDIRVHDENAALGAATKSFNKVVGSMALTASHRFNIQHHRTDYKGYEYQLCRIYKLDEVGNEKTTDNLSIMGRGWSMINLPETTDFYGTLDQKLLERLIRNDNEIFNKSFYYLLKAEQDFNRRIPPEMLTINLFKCIELIINSFKGRKFRNKLKNASEILSLSPEDIRNINVLKLARDNGDVAHPRTGRRSDFYPHQFPIPENIDYPNFWYSGLTAKVLLQYFLYIDSEFEVRIDREEWTEKDILYSVNFGSYYLIHPTIRERKKLIPYIKSKLASAIRVPYSEIRLRRYAGDKIVFFVLDHLRFELNDESFVHR